MQKFYRNILKTLRVSVPKGLDSRRPLAACATTNRNPYDFTPGDHGLESASFGTDELTKQQ